MCESLTNPSCRCFTFGIGSGASTVLVEGLARAGNGTAEFVKEGERMQPKVFLRFVWNTQNRLILAMYECSTGKGFMQWELILE